MTKKYAMVFTYSLAHFAVDFACAFLLFRIIYGTQDWYMSLLFYNFCAFALQMPFGLLADRWNRNAVCAAIGCVLVAFSFACQSTILAAAVMAGIGNGLFHVGGGINILNMSNKKPTLLGIFVSPGAFGIYFGTMLGKQNDISVALVVSTLATIAITILAVYYINRRSFYSDNVTISFQGVVSPSILFAIGCLFIVVCLRSYIGMILKFPWKSQGNWGTVFICAVVFGKLAGGFLAVKLGALKASVVSLGLASILFMFSNHPLAGVTAIFFFNMSMPITLWAIAQILHNCKGFSFGLLTFGLFLGFVPVYLEYPPLFTSPTGYAIAGFASLILLWAGLKKVEV